MFYTWLTRKERMGSDITHTVNCVSRIQESYDLS